MTKKQVLVTGATGQQGGSVVRSLASSTDNYVRALVRDPESDRSQALKALGVKLVVGTFEDSASLDAALSGIDSVFAVTTPFVDGIQAEVEQGVSIVDAAVRTGTPHVIYSSVAGANLDSGIPHFDSKYQVEEHLVRTGLNWTVTAPVYFMDNAAAPWNIPGFGQGVFSHALNPGTTLQQIAVSDIGKVNAAVIEGGERFYGRRIEYAGDELTSTEMTASLATATGRDLTYVEQPIEQVRAMSEDMALMYEWFERVGYQVDIPALKAEFSDLQFLDFSSWANTVDWNTLLAG